MDINKRITQLLQDRGWTPYRLAKESGLSDATVGNIFRRNTVPSMATLTAVCNGFGITLSQFFAEDGLVELTPELQNEVVVYLLIELNQKFFLPGIRKEPAEITWLALFIFRSNHQADPQHRPVDLPTPRALPPTPHAQEYLRQAPQHPARQSSLPGLPGT